MQTLHLDQSSSSSSKCFLGTREEFRLLWNPRFFNNTCSSSSASSSPTSSLLLQRTLLICLIFTFSMFSSVVKLAKSEMEEEEGD